jgi:presenilin-like A22 family membrane protease
MTIGEEEQKGEWSLSIFLCVGMGMFLLLTQLLALALASPFEASGIKAFQNPESIWNPVYFFILIIGFTALILIVLRFGGKKLVYFIMLGAVAITMFYVMAVLVPYGLIPIGITLALTLLLYKYPEWYVIDATGLIVGGGAAAIFGISLGILPVLLLMIILAVYDAVSVYKTKHMVSLAESVVELRLPILFVLPRKRHFSLLRANDKSEEKIELEEAFFMGLGDAIIPSVLVVSAFVTYASVAPALGALIGTLVGYGILSRFAGKGKPHAGLPLLNSGAIIGFIIGYLIAVYQLV